MIRETLAFDGEGGNLLAHCFKIVALNMISCSQTQRIADQWGNSCVALIY